MWAYLGKAGKGWRQVVNFAIYIPRTPVFGYIGTKSQITPALLLQLGAFGGIQRLKPEIFRE